MKRTLYLLLLLLLTGNVFAQKESYLSFELAGSGGLASFNFEQSFYQKEGFNLNFRTGFSLTPIDKNNGIVLVFPIMVHAAVGKTKHKLDAGIGQSISVSTKGQAFILMPLSLGYRFQPPKKNYYLRIAYTPIVSYLLDLQWQHWAGITIGIKLNRKNEEN